MHRFVSIVLFATAAAACGNGGSDDSGDVDARPPGRSGEVCNSAERIDVPGGVGSTMIRASTDAFHDNYDTNACEALFPDFHTLGPDRVYVVNVPSSHRLFVSVDGIDNPFWPLVYLVDGPASSCTAEPACIPGYPTWTDRGSQERTIYRNTSANARDVYAVVDGNREADYGEFTLSVVIDPLPATPPQGDTCEQAAAVTFTDGMATMEGDVAFTRGYWNDYARRCTRTTEAGNDRAYKVTIGAGERLDATLTIPATNMWNGLVYVLSSDAGSCNSSTCLGTNTHSYQMPSRATYDNATGAPTDVFVVVDGDVPGYSDAPYRLDLRLGATPPGETCASAEPVDVSSGSATVSGTTVEYHDDLAPQTAGFGPAGDHFYALRIPAQQTLTVTMSPDTSGQLFDLGLYLIAGPATNCTNGASCLATGDVNGAGMIETMTYANTGDTPVDVFVGVDSRVAPAAGAYTLTFSVAP